MQAIKNAVFGNAQPESQSDQKPITSDTGVGTSNEAHDVGNSLDQSSSTAVEPSDEIPKDIESQSGQEPRSGYTGAGTATDPYDAGNKIGQSRSSAEEIADNNVDENASSTIKSPPSAIPTDTSTYPGLQGHPLINAEPTPAPTPTINSSSTSEPPTGLDPVSGREPTYSEQGGNRPLEEPTSEQTGAVIGEKAETEGAQAGKPQSDPSLNERAPKSEDPSGKPLGTVPDVSREQTQLQDPTEDTSESKGTGEIYIKSTGVAAQGGDFDAANPGAGKEADRLLEQSENGHGEASTASADSDLADSTKKLKLTDKIKEKLHLKKKSSAE